MRIKLDDMVEVIAGDDFGPSKIYFDHSFRIHNVHRINFFTQQIIDDDLYLCITGIEVLQINMKGAMFCDRIGIDSH